MYESLAAHVPVGLHGLLKVIPQRIDEAFQSLRQCSLQKLKHTNETCSIWPKAEYQKSSVPDCLSLHALWTQEQEQLYKAGWLERYGTSYLALFQLLMHRNVGK